MLSANLSLPGFEIRYTTDGSIPNVESNLYENPVEVTGIVRLRTFDRNGRGSRMVSVGVPGT